MQNETKALALYMNCSLNLIQFLTAQFSFDHFSQKDRVYSVYRQQWHNQDRPPKSSNQGPPQSTRIRVLSRRRLWGCKVLRELQPGSGAPLGACAL